MGGGKNVPAVKKLTCEGNVRKSEVKYIYTVYTNACTRENQTREPELYDE